MRTTTRRLPRRHEGFSSPEQENNKEHAMNVATAKLEDVSLSEQVAGLMVGAVDLHCHSGPAAMPRMLDHHEAMLDAAAAGFESLLYKDHYYAGMAHAKILQKLVPYVKTRLYSGIALNNASGGIN